MKSLSSWIRSAILSPLPAGALYLTIVGTLFVMLVASVADVIDQRSDVIAAAATLAQLQGRQPRASGVGGTAMPPGTPFLEGKTVTIAGAALLERVSASVTRFGGRVLSSQLDVNKSQTTAGRLAVIANCELDQPHLQELLYDLEAGMPLLFVDQLVVQTPVSGGMGADRLRVRLAVSGQWRGEK